MDALMQAGRRAAAHTRSKWHGPRGVRLWLLAPLLCPNFNLLPAGLEFSTYTQEPGPASDSRLQLEAPSLAPRFRNVASPHRPADLPRAEHLRRSRRGPARAPRPAGLIVAQRECEEAQENEEFQAQAESRRRLRISRSATRRRRW